MALDQDKLEQLSAALDGELDDAGQAEVNTLLEQDEEARAAHVALAATAGILGGVEAVTPPPHLRHAILDSYMSSRSSKNIASSRHATAPVAGVRGWWDSLWSAPFVKYAGAFGFGVVVALVFASSDQNSRRAFDDVSGLVGTISQPGDLSAVNGDSRMVISKSEIAGSVVTYRQGSLMIIDLNLMTSSPVEIVAHFTAGDIWFNGFAQMDNPGTTVSAQAGEVRLRVEGNRRLAVYLHNDSGEATTVSLKFYAAGELLHEGDLRFSEGR